MSPNDCNSFAMPFQRSGEVMLHRRDFGSNKTIYREATGSPFVTSRLNADGTIHNVFSTQEVGRDGHRVFTAGIGLDNYLRNAIVNWAHDNSIPPIGRARNLTKSATFEGDIEYADTAFAQMIYEMVQERFINSTSLEWLPVDSKRSADPARPGGYDFLKIDLLAIAQVPVPALPSALAAARSNGTDLSPMYDWAERALDIGNHQIVSRSNLEVIRRESKMPLPAKRGETVVLPLQRRKHGSLAEFVRAAIDTVQLRAPSGSNTLDLTAGGFLVQTEFSEKWIASVYAGASPFLGLCDQRQTDNYLAKIKIPAIDEVSRADGFRNGGMFGYWEKEGDQITASLPKWRMVETTGNKVIVLAFVANELLTDDKMLEAFLNKGVPEELSFVLGEKVVSGTGAGVPLGITNAPATITVPKDQGQIAGSIVRANVLGMWTRLASPSRRRAVWLVNEDADLQLEAIAADPAGPANLYIPSGVCGNEYPLLKGRPVIEVEQCPVLGQPGDIVLADLSKYMIVDGGQKSSVSMDVSFLNDQTVLKFTWYVDGRPSVVSPVMPFNGSGVTRSPFVCLAAR